ncbi:hypothetical protein Hanom_Chr04g00343771 [Helianthus anomalus]
MFSEFGFFKSNVAMSLFSGFTAVAGGSLALQGCWMEGWILQPALQLHFLRTLSL